jgi:2-polyprenyl-3-methyl-5-hydroxy-6-metoxy-1,4-benzoquinol methylase
MADQAATHMKQVQLLFDELAATWSAKYAPKGQLTGRLMQFADAVNRYVGAQGRVLDLGCGTGELARRMAAAGLRVSGCDISEEMLGHADISDSVKAVEWVKLDPAWRVLPFESAIFDAVVAASVLEYVDSPCLVLHECARVLRPGGALLFTVPDAAHPVRWLESAARAVIRVPLIRAVVGGWPRADQYLSYLEISCQRHPAGWWDAMAAQAGLISLNRLKDKAEHSPLRLFIVQRPISDGAISLLVPRRETLPLNGEEASPVMQRDCKYLGRIGVQVIGTAERIVLIKAHRTIKPKCDWSRLEPDRSYLPNDMRLRA